MSLKREFSFWLNIFEWMSVLFIAGLLAALGSVHLIQMMNDQVVRMVRDVFLHVVHLARAEAIYSQQFVTICASSDQHRCSGD